jgi:hypothetical protein
MYLRITRGTFDPAAATAVVPLTEEVRETLARLPGHADALVGLDRAAGRLVIVTTWDTEAHARFPRGWFVDLVTRLGGAGTRLEPPEVYELVAG